MEKLDHFHDRLDCVVPKPLELVYRRNIEKFGTLAMKNPRILQVGVYNSGGSWEGRPGCQKYSDSEGRRHA